MWSDEQIQLLRSSANMTLRIAGAYFQCEKEMRTVFSVLSVLSFLTSSFVLIFQYRNNPKLRTFPNNTVLIICFLGAFTSGALSLGVMVDYEHLTPSKFLPPQQHQPREKTLFLKIICTIQGICFQIGVNATVWNWIFVNILLYLMIVRQVKTASLVNYRYYYYGSLLMISGFSAVLMLITEGGVKTCSEALICWLEDSTLRFQFLYAHMMFGIVVFVCVAPPVLKKIWQACQTVNDRRRVEVMRETMWHQMVFAAYLTLVFFITVIYAFNNLFAHSNSEYIAQTTYSYCVMSAINIGIVGGVMVLIFTVTGKVYRRIRRGFFRMCCCTQEASKTKPANNELLSSQTQSTLEGGQRGSLEDKEDGQDIESMFFVIDEEKDMFIMRNSTPSASPPQSTYTAPQPRDLCPSACESKCVTAVSVPPNPRDRMVHRAANDAYTSAMLAYVSDQLRDEGLSFNSDTLESFITEHESNSNFSTHNSQSLRGSELDLDSRLALAKQRWLKEHHNPN